MKNTLSYLVYARKSSEDSQRQIASIGDQVAALEAVVGRESLHTIDKPLKEERSAKDPGRPVFNAMLDRIETGEANAILCWDIDRLSRNPIDNGRLQWMLQKGVIEVIKTPSRSYYPEDAGLLMSIEGGRATDYVLRLSKNVIRGLNSRVAKGWRPCAAPIGYMNVGEEGDKSIVSDPERFELVRRIWDLFLTGTYSVSEIRDLANNKWALRTFPRRKLGGRELTMSHMYTLLRNPFYYGEFEWNDPETGEMALFKGNHQPMITKAEYARAQLLLGRKGKQRPQEREFAFTGLMNCGECGSAITAEEKNQVICDCKCKFSNVSRTDCPRCGTQIDKMKHPKFLRYIYYRCSKKKNRSCTQRYVNVADLEAQFNNMLDAITIDEDYLNVALDYLAAKRKEEGHEENTTRKSLENALGDCTTRLRNLEREYTSSQNSDYGLYTPEEFRASKKDLATKRKQIEKEIADVGDQLDRSIDETARVVEFCHLAKREFNGGDLKKKRGIFSTIGSNMTITGKKLTIDKLHPYLLVENELKAQRALYAGLERGNPEHSERWNAIFVSSIPNWLRG